MGGVQSPPPTPSAVPFVTVHGPRGTFSVDPQALESLRSLEGPVAVVGVCGAARQGKSTLLNMLLRHLGTGDRDSPCPPCFPVSDSTDYCTKGLWLCAAASKLPLTPEDPAATADGAPEEDFDDDEYSYFAKTTARDPSISPQPLFASFTLMSS